mmetsp:Transcript_10436/g.23614  ORF Transcript_10436/g.23614 Transcript_10436/m.23614 type:complete len:888 (+) Transcript_10436:59-2722(+)
MSGRGDGFSIGSPPRSVSIAAPPSPRRATSGGPRSKRGSIPNAAGVSPRLSKAGGDEDPLAGGQLLSKGLMEPRVKERRSARPGTSFVSNSSAKWVQLLPVFEPCKSEFMHAVTQALSLTFFQSKAILFHRHEEVTEVMRIHSGCATVDVDGIVVETASVDSIFGETMFFSAREKHDLRLQATTTAIVEKLPCSTFFLLLGDFPSEAEHFNRLRQTYLRGLSRKASVKHIPIFKGCGLDFLQRIDSRLTQQTFFEGQLIIEEGTEGSTCMLISFGRVVVTIGGRHVAELGNGSLFGELAVLGSAERRTASVIAQALCKAHTLHRTVLEATLEEFPEEKQRFDLLKKRQLLSVTEVLQKADFFKECKKEFLEVLAERFELRLVMPGEEVVRMNTEVDAIFIVESGVCQCSALGKSIASLQAGSLFGEMTALGLVETATATVAAVTPCFLQVLHRAVLIAALESWPEEMKSFLAIAQARHSELQQYASVEKPDFSEYSIFSSCSKEFQERLCTGVQTRLFLPGEVIIAESSIGHECFILMSGQAQARKDNIVVKDYHPGALFGELALFSLNKGRREATVKAKGMCVVAELTESVIWEVLEAFPEEMRVFCTTCLHDLQHTVNLRVMKLYFFHDADSAFVSFLLTQMQQRIAMPEEWVIKEGTLLEEKLIILNRGIMETWQEDIEVSLVQPGGHVGGTVVLGLHQKYPFSHRARPMCHLITMTRGALLEGLRRNPNLKAWVKVAKRHEHREYTEMLRLIRELKQRRRLDDHATRNYGRIFPHTHEALSFGVGKSVLQACFSHWVSAWHRGKTADLVNTAMQKAVGARWALRVPGSQQQGSYMDAGEEPVRKDKLPALHTAPWDAKLKALLSCSSPRDLYMHPGTPRWQHS